MRPLNEEEWKKLQEIVKKIDKEQSIGVDFHNVSFILSKDGIKSNYKSDLHNRIKESTMSRKLTDSEKETLKKMREIKYTIAPPRNPKNKRSIMEELRQMFLDRRKE
jgi:hypothetical protein